MKNIGLFFLIGIVLLINNSALAQGCLTTFSSHKTGSIIIQYPVQISGIATVPPNGHLWILVQLDGFNGWYPQGNGERKVDYSNWDCTVYLGLPGQTGFFDIATAVVNDNVNQALNNWVSTAKANGYPAIPFPSEIDSCTSTIIKVEKR